MRCPKCQFENPEGVKFCGGCGSRLEKPCPQCGHKNPPQFRFCGECGQSLEQLPASPVDYAAPHSYTPKFLADKILTSRSSMEGERKLVTVLFADVANFTSLSEKLDPEEVHQIMDGCFKILMDEIHRFEGTINQFTGDGVMALFGAPVAHEDHAQRACHAALSIQKAMGEYGGRVARDYGMDFKMRIGLNSGQVIVGAIGDDLRMDYTAIGDTTNLASRMEGLSPPGGVVASRNTHKLAKDYFEFRPLGKVEVKGKEKPQEAFELLKAGEVETRIGASVAKGLTRFVGRKNSMAALMETYEKARAGSGQVVGMVGEAGVGKSRLLLEFRNRLPQDEFTYLEGRCIHFGGSMPYLPVLDVLRSYFGIMEGDREFLTRKMVTEKVLELDRNLAETLPALQDLLSLKVEDEAYLRLEPKQRRERVFEALRDLLLRGSQIRPIILAVEDLHWIDKTTVEFLDYFIGWMANVRIMLILLYRPEYTHQWGSRSYYKHIGLDQLTLESSAELVKAILEEGETAPELRNLILNRAAGNPLFMEELTHTLLENGSIQKEQDQYVLARTPSDLQVPDTVQGIIAARIDRLEENLKKIMQVASVIGREFAFRILQAIIGMRENLKSQLLNLQGLEFIYEKSLFPELEYIFKHALTQEVAYKSLLSNRRKEIHKRIGKAIEELYAGSLEEFYEVLAYHYAKGDEAGKAYRYLKLSGNKATRTHALREAYDFYKEAVRQLDTIPESTENKKERIEVLELMRAPILFLGFPEDSLTFLQQGERLSRELGDTRRLAFFYGSMGHYYTHAGDHLLAIKCTEEAFEEARKAQDIELMVPLAASLFNTYAGTGEWYKTLDVAPEVIDLIEKAGRESDFFGAGGPNRYTMLCGYYSSSMAHLGHFEEAKASIEKGLRNAIQVHDVATLGGAENIYGIFFYMKGDWGPAKEHLEKAITHYEEAKWTVGFLLALSVLGHTYSFLGDPEIGRRHAEKGLQIYQDSGIELWLSYNHFVLGMIHLDLGDLENAKSAMEEALRLSRKNNEKGWEGWSWIGLGRILGMREPRQMDKAEECFFKGLEILRGLKMKASYSWGHLFLGEFYLAAGEKEKAKENLKKAEGMFQEMGMDYWLARTYAVYAELSERNGDRSEAKENLGKAIEMLKKCGADGWVEKYEKELVALS
jgi:class 3 adenylate cyclase/tetratricopeptide (TPR) repeat protein